MNNIICFGHFRFALHILKQIIIFLNQQWHVLIYQTYLTRDLHLRGNLVVYRLFFYNFTIYVRGSNDSQPVNFTYKFTRSSYYQNCFDHSGEFTGSNNLSLMIREISLIILLEQGETRKKKYIIPRASKCLIKKL